MHCHQNLILLIRYTLRIRPKPCPKIYSIYTYNLQVLKKMQSRIVVHKKIQAVHIVYDTRWGSRWESEWLKAFCWTHGQSDKCRSVDYFILLRRYSEESFYYWLPSFWSIKIQAKQHFTFIVKSFCDQGDIYLEPWSDTIIIWRIQLFLFLMWQCYKGFVCEDLLKKIYGTHRFYPYGKSVDSHFAEDIIILTIFHDA